LSRGTKKRRGRKKKERGTPKELEAITGEPQFRKRTEVLPLEGFLRGCQMGGVQFRRGEPGGGELHQKRELRKAPKRGKRHTLQ